MNPYVCIMHTRLPFLTARMATLLELAVLATQVFLDTVLIMEFIFSSLFLCFALLCNCKGVTCVVFALSCMSVAKVLLCSPH